MGNSILQITLIGIIISPLIVYLNLLILDIKDQFGSVCRTFDKHVPVHCLFRLCPFNRN